MANEKAYGFTHKQVVPATTWTINHGLGYGVGQIVDAFADIGGVLQKIIPLSMTESDSTVTLTFSVAYSGEAYVI